MRKFVVWYNCRSSLLSNQPEIMAKKKKGTDNEKFFDEAIENLLNSFSEEEKIRLEQSIENFFNSGKTLEDLKEVGYTYQRPDYTKMTKPLPDYLQALLDTTHPSETLLAYHKAHCDLSKLTHEEQEEAIRNLIMHILAAGLTRDFVKENVKTSMPLLGIFQLIDDFELTGLFDIILETLKQGTDFFGFYYLQFEDAATLILAHVGKEHLAELKEAIKTEGYLCAVYPIIFNAVVQMAVENPYCRLQVLAWVADVLNTCIDRTIPTLYMDTFVKSLAQIKAADLLPLIKNIYKEYRVPAMEIKSGIRGVSTLLSKGTKDRIVEFTDFKALLNEIAENEENDFDDDFDDDEEADYQEYAYTLDITLEDSPHKVYRQLIVPSYLPLDWLGKVIAYAVGWEGYHLDKFVKGREEYLVPDDNSDLNWGEDSRDYTVDLLLERVGSKIKWVYDFGDYWEHQVKLVAKKAVDSDQDIPVTLVKGSGACPPEDCGGVRGYSHLLEVLQNPQDEEYKDMVEWIGYSFDPKKFSLAKARKRIKDYLKEEGAR